jgi:DNA (cytosine-5)-methyltransferase 1
VFDFFAGCGGTSLGFKQAGMSIVFALDCDADAAMSYRTNFPDAVFCHSDVGKFNGGALTSLLKRGDAPVLFSGCAPCQPFSRQNNGRSKDDPRRGLLAEFGKLIRKFRPEYLFVENVPGMQRLKGGEGPLLDFIDTLNDLEYLYDIDAIPALRFGVPQTRERLVLLGSRLAPISLPRQTHGAGALPVSTVRDWIDNLPPIAAGGTHPDDPCHQAAALSKLNLKRIRATPEGGNRDSWPKKLWLNCHRRHSGHTDVYGRLAWDKPAAGLTTKCISYSNGRFGHPEQDRALSAREAACLQTFPIDYRFCGNLMSKARQIGNAVPPLMSRAIGLSVVEHYLTYARTGGRTRNSTVKKRKDKRHVV